MKTKQARINIRVSLELPETWVTKEDVAQGYPYPGVGKFDVVKQYARSPDEPEPERSENSKIMDEEMREYPDFDGIKRGDDVKFNEKWEGWYRVNIDEIRSIKEVQVLFRLLDISVNPEKLSKKNKKLFHNNPHLFKKI